MRLSAPGVRVADVETCDFSLLTEASTEAVLRIALPDTWERYLDSAVSRALIERLGVQRRYLTHQPGAVPDPARRTAWDLALSAVDRLGARRRGMLAGLDALIFVSTSNPNPCNSQAALLAAELGIAPSCSDLKAGCSGGVLGLMQGALLLAAGCERILVVMAETLSHFTPTNDLRMLLSVGDGAACVLLERAEGPGFLTMMHGSAPRYAHTMTVRESFPPVRPGARYEYEFRESNAAAQFIRERWSGLFRESLASAKLAADDLSHWFFHQTHKAQVEDLLAGTGLRPDCAARVVERYGNMGTPTFAVAMADAFPHLAPGQRYLMQAVGGGVSWCAIVAEHAA